MRLTGPEGAQLAPVTAGPTLPLTQVWLNAHCSLLTAHCSLLTAHCSLLLPQVWLTAHCSLLSSPLLCIKAAQCGQRS